MELPDGDRRPGPGADELELSDRTRAARPVPRTEPGDDAARRPRDRGHAVLAGPVQERVRSLARVRSIDRHRRGHPAERGIDRAGRDEGLRDLAGARRRHRPRSLRCLPAEGGPPERHHIGRGAPDARDLPRPGARDPARAVVDVRPGTPDHVRARRHVHRSVPGDRPRPRRPAERRDPLAPGTRGGPLVATGRRGDLPGAVDPARPDGGRVPGLGGRRGTTGSARRGRGGPGHAGARRPPSPRRRPERRGHRPPLLDSRDPFALRRGPRSGCPGPTPAWSGGDVDVGRSGDTRDHPPTPGRRP